jgi:hypothetical protein
VTQHCAWCAVPYTDDNPLRIHDALDSVLCERCYRCSDDATYAFYGTQLAHLRHWIAVIEGVRRQLKMVVSSPARLEHDGRDIVCKWHDGA